MLRCSQCLQSRGLRSWQISAVATRSLSSPTPTIHTPPDSSLISCSPYSDSIAPARCGQESAPLIAVPPAAPLLGLGGGGLEGYLLDAALCGHDEAA